MNTRLPGMVLRAILILSIAGLLTIPLHGQANANLQKAFSLEDALNYALQNYPAVRASLEQLNAARAGVSIARAQYLPSLSGVYQDS